MNEPGPDDPLEPSRALAERWLQALSRFALDHIEGLERAPAAGPSLREAARVADAVSRPIGEAPLAGGIDEVIALLDQAAAASLCAPGPGYLAYIPGGGIYAAALADFVADCLNRYTGMPAPAPGAVPAGAGRAALAVRRLRLRAGGAGGADPGQLAGHAVGGGHRPPRALRRRPATFPRPPPTPRRRPTTAWPRPPAWPGSPPRNLRPIAGGRRSSGCGPTRWRGAIAAGSRAGACNRSWWSPPPAPPTPAPSIRCRRWRTSAPRESAVAARGRRLRRRLRADRPRPGAAGGHRAGRQHRLRSPQGHVPALRHRLPAVQDGEALRRAHHLGADYLQDLTAAPGEVSFSPVGAGPGAEPGLPRPATVAAADAARGRRVPGGAGREAGSGRALRQRAGRSDGPRAAAGDRGPPPAVAGDLPAVPPSGRSAGSLERPQPRFPGGDQRAPARAPVQHAAPRRARIGRRARPSPCASACSASAPTPATSNAAWKTSAAAATSSS